MITNNFAVRHNGIRNEDLKKILKTIGVSSVDQLMDETVPGSVRLDKELDLPEEGLNEYEYFSHIKELGHKNKVFKSYIGMGYYNTILPGVIQRNILENPGWYTAYTPYQAEISQGRLEALLNFQTVISDLTGLEIANASLLDEATAAGEAMSMLFGKRSRAQVKANVNKFFVSEKCFPQTIAVLKSHAKALGIELIIGDHEKTSLDDSFFGVLLQYPDDNGEVHDFSKFVEKAKAADIKIAVVADLLSLTLLTPPGEWGADIVAGTTQRFGIPMGFGGPHAGYFATKEEYKRNVPGRIIGISIDKEGNNALRMALQTREQHIKRERATSNICTAQALLASMAGMYAAYHGPEGLKKIAQDINMLAGILAKEIEKYGYKQLNKSFFDTVLVELPKGLSNDKIKKIAEENKINFRYKGKGHVNISLDETTSLDDVKKIIEIFAKANGKSFSKLKDKVEDYEKVTTFPGKLQRKSQFLTHPVFNSYHSETEMMRYMNKLENRDLALNRTMISLGSCTMKLTAAVEMFPLSWPEFNSIHPFVPKEQAEGYLELIKNLEKDLCAISGYKAITFMPNSGAAGEYTGLMIIKAYHESRGEGHRNITLIPASSHGTNPASAIVAGTEVVIVKSDEHGNIDIDDLKVQAEKHKENLSSIMITYPSTHGVFEERILEAVKIVHDNGGQVYMDGANMNAKVGFSDSVICGGDVGHLNLHKTFAIPHGGGGPGVGPVGVKEHLVEFLPKHPLFETGGKNGVDAIAAAPFGSPLVLPITYGYIKLMGRQGLIEATKTAVLNANYLRAALEKDYKIYYTGKNGHVAHEMIIDCNVFKRTIGIDSIDIAKRLMDYGFHAPTVSFPIPGTLMVEPTESEPLKELDRFIEAMLAIRQEIRDVEEGKVDRENNVIKNAPHTAAVVCKDKWDKPYSREKAAFPMPYLYETKYFTPVSRIEEAYGDKNLVCTCEPLDSYFQKK